MNASPPSHLRAQVQSALHEALADCDTRWLTAAVVACGVLLRLVLGA